jgi:hypothetical protein
MKSNGKFWNRVPYSGSNIKLRWRDREKLLSSSDQSGNRDADLARFDSKVHNALLEMQLHMGQQFRLMGIPFFGLDSSVIVDSGGKDESRVSTVRLRELQRKMLDYLESMYGP